MEFLFYYPRPSRNLALSRRFLPMIHCSLSSATSARSFHPPYAFIGRQLHWRAHPRDPPPSPLEPLYSFLFHREDIYAFVTPIFILHHLPLFLLPFARARKFVLDFVSPHPLFLMLSVIAQESLPRAPRSPGFFFTVAPLCFSSENLVGKGGISRTAPVPPVAPIETRFLLAPS